jgi:hypothetical protein
LAFELGRILLLANEGNLVKQQREESLPLNRTAISSISKQAKPRKPNQQMAKNKTKQKKQKNKNKKF